MFTKIHYAFYDKLFDFYGILADYYWHKSLKASNEATRVRLEKKVWKCTDKREDILEIMFALKGLS